TVIIAAIIAVLLEPMVELFMRIRMPRGLASFLVCSISLMFIYFAGLGVYTESIQMKDDLPAYGARISELVDGAAGRMERFESGLYRTLLPKRLQDASGAVPASPPVDQSVNGGAARGKLNKKAPEP